MDDLVWRRQWFSEYTQKLEQSTRLTQPDSRRNTCPCCGYPTLSERGAFEMCHLCQWEDDGQDDPHADEVWGGPNSDYSLAEARTNFTHHLVMYRPHDSRYFPQNPAILDLKRKLIAVYEQMSATDTPSDRAKLEQQEQAIIAKLLITPQRTLPLP